MSPGVAEVIPTILGFGDTPFYMPEVDSRVKRCFITNANLPESVIADWDMPTIGLYKLLGKLCPYNSGDLICTASKNAAVKELIERQCGGEPSVLVLALDKNKEELIRRAGWRYLNTESKTRMALESKMCLHAILREAGITPIEHITLTQNKVVIEEILFRLGKPIIAQIDGNQLNGRGTYSIGSETDWLNISRKFKDTHKWKFTRLVRGRNCNMSGCITRAGDFHAGPFRQLVGIPQLTRVKFGYCGTVLRGNYSPQEIATARAISASIGRVLKRHGYRGCFGVDMIVGGAGDVKVVEINARMQSTTGLFNMAQEHIGGPSFGTLHVFEHLHMTANTNAGEISRVMRLAEALDWSQIVIFNDGVSRIVRDAIPPGTYMFDGNTLVQCSNSLRLQDTDYDKFVITRFRNPGSIIKADEMLCIIQFCRNVVTKQDVLQKSVREVVRAVRAKIFGNCDRA